MLAKCSLTLKVKHYAKWNKPFRKTNIAWFDLYEVSKVVKFVESKRAMALGRYSGERPLPLFSRSVMSDSLWPHGLRHARLPCPSPSPWVYSNSCPLSQWCHPTISSYVIPFSSCLQSFPASGSFPMSWLFSSGGQSIGASASVLPVNIQGWFHLGLTGWIFLQSKGLSRVFSNTTVQKRQFFGAQLSL